MGRQQIIRSWTYRLNNLKEHLPRLHKTQRFVKQTGENLYALADEDAGSLSDRPSLSVASAAISYKHTDMTPGINRSRGVGTCVYARSQRVYDTRNLYYYI